MAHTLNHPDIGEARGSKAKEGVEQYLGIQYATVKDRFAPAVLKEYTGEGVDATKIGSQTAPIPDGAEHEQDLIQHRLPKVEQLRHSDTEALNLNITYPTPQNREDFLWQADNKLPVFLFIHGGGFMVGSASFPQYDMANFVRLSYEKGLPIIAVTMNYRLGAPGQLTSKEMRDAGYLRNNALRDQGVAIQWVRKYIAGFGGDPGNITLAGESAGGVSCTYHLQSQEPLFKRVMPMSGTSLLLPPLPVEITEHGYQSGIKRLGLGSLSVEERLSKLLSIDAGELARNLLSVPLLPSIDEDLPVLPNTFADFHAGKVDYAGMNWCESIMIGDCEFDGSIMGLRLGHRKKGIARAFCEEMQKSFSPSEYTDRLLQGYGITPDLDDDTGFTKVLEAINDAHFYTPTTAYAECLTAKGLKAYVYRFNEPNPWEGQWKGRANHILDITFLFQNFNEYLSEEQKHTAEDFATAVFKFVAGQVPWDEWKSDCRVAKALGPYGKVEVVEDVPEEVQRRKVLLELAEVVEGGMDHLSEVFNAFLRWQPAT